MTTNTYVGKFIEDMCELELVNTTNEYTVKSVVRELRLQQNDIIEDYRAFILDKPDYAGLNLDELDIIKKYSVFQVWLVVMADTDNAHHKKGAVLAIVLANYMMGNRTAFKHLPFAFQQLGGVQRHVITPKEWTFVALGMLAGSVRYEHVPVSQRQFEAIHQPVSELVHERHPYIAQDVFRHPEYTLRHLCTLWFGSFCAKIRDDIHGYNDFITEQIGAIFSDFHKGYHDDILIKKNWWDE